MSGVVVEAQRRFQQGAAKAQLIKHLLDIDTDNPAELADFIETFVYSYLRGPFGEEFDDIPESAEFGILWTMWMLIGGDEAAWQCREAVNAMQQLTPTD